MFAMKKAAAILFLEFKFPPRTRERSSREAAGKQQIGLNEKNTGGHFETLCQQGGMLSVRWMESFGLFHRA
jgi:hypothetical protein